MEKYLAQRKLYLFAKLIQEIQGFTLLVWVQIAADTLSKKQQKLVVAHTRL